MPTPDIADEAVEEEGSSDAAASDDVSTETGGADDEADDGAADSTDDGSVVGGFDGVEEDRKAEESMEVGEADLGIDEDDGIVASFDGVDGGSESSSSSGSSGSSESSSSSGSSGRSRSSGGISIEDTIEEGLAELAAVGLEGREREAVSSEMEQVASKFKVGYFGREVAEKYLKRDLEDIPPEIGLIGALIGFAAITIKKRPDGEERLNDIVSKFRNRGEESERPDAPQRRPPEQQGQQAQPQQPQQQPSPEQMTQRDVPNPEPETDEPVEGVAEPPQEPDTGEA